jgi:iron complex transport system ATP-binding protein
MDLMLEVRDLACGYASKTVIENIRFKAFPGEMLVILGPNGVGKTTFFKTMLGLLPRIRGEVLLDGKPIDMRPDHPDMKRFAYVPQAHVPAFAFTVMEIVLMGRTSRMRAFSTPSGEDREIAFGMMEELGLSHLSDRLYTEVSGGERQLVLIARAMTQEPDILIMDEPAASLDLGNQAKLLRLSRELAHSKNLTILMTSHNPDHALLVADKVLLLHSDGYLSGDVDDVLTEENLSRAYGTEIEIIEKEGCNATDHAKKSCLLKL